MLMRALPVHTAHETSGAARIRHSLRPLYFRGRRLLANLGPIGPRECGGVSSVIASAAKQSMAAKRKNGLLRGACHRARIRATLSLARTISGQHRAPQYLFYAGPHAVFAAFNPSFAST